MSTGTSPGPGLGGGEFMSTGFCPVLFILDGVCPVGIMLTGFAPVMVISMGFAPVTVMSIGFAPVTFILIGFAVAVEGAAVEREFDIVADVFELLVLFDVVSVSVIEIAVSQLSSQELELSTIEEDAVVPVRVESVDCTEDSSWDIASSAD